ncbi:unnamed protein product [Schistocephalus solidus]|uniref:Mucin-5AC-like n=1 Tax=Schistocephalus solidus TaxID=70667 RepID=A0A183T927_SCHSO|nr:unnamed protein product [Schistocephalus solidus]
MSAFTMATSETAGETVGVAVPPLQLGATRTPTTVLVPTQGSLSTSDPANSSANALSSTAPTVSAEDSAATTTFVTTMASLPTERHTVASDLVPSTLDTTSQIPQHSIPPVTENPDVPSSTTENIAVESTTVELSSIAPEKTTAAVPEMVNSAAAVVTVGTTTDAPGSTLAMTTVGDLVSSTGPPGVNNDSLAVTTASATTPKQESSTFPPSVVGSESNGTWPTTENLTYPTTMRPNISGVLLLGPAGVPDWRLYLILISTIALALIVILLIGWILTCICMRVAEGLEGCKQHVIMKAPQLPTEDEETSSEQRGPDAFVSKRGFSPPGDTEKPKGVPLGPRTGGITDTHNNRHGESDGCAVNSHTTSTPMAQRPYSQSEQGWQTPTLFMPPPSSIQAPQDQQNPSYHTLSSFQPAGGGGGGTWSNYDHSVGRRGVRAAEEGGPGASSLRMHPNMHRGLLAEMNAGVRLHPVAPQPPNPI